MMGAPQRLSVAAMLVWALVTSTACGAELAHGRPVGAEGDRVPSRFEGRPLAVLDSAPLQEREAGDARHSQARSHVVQPGETLWRIARRFGTSVEQLAALNGIADPTRVRAGTRLTIPASEAPAHGSTTAGASLNKHPEAKRYPLRWPVEGVITSRFGARGGRPHDGIDIGAPPGTEVRAAASGKVIFASRHGGYGNLVIVRHDNGLVTVYAHNTVNLVRKGQTVRAGQVIAKVGSSGRASGPHLHFEVRQGTTPKNPLRFLPP